VAQVGHPPARATCGGLSRTPDEEPHSTPIGEPDVSHNGRSRSLVRPAQQQNCRGENHLVVQMKPDLVAGNEQVHRRRSLRPATCGRSTPHRGHFPGFTCESAPKWDPTSDRNFVRTGVPIGAAQAQSDNRPTRLATRARCGTGVRGGVDTLFNCVTATKEKPPIVVERPQSRLGA
jgi:hypothetical protein